MLRYTRTFLLSSIVLAAALVTRSAAAQGSVLFRLHTGASGDRLLADTSGAFALFGKAGPCAAPLASGAGTRFMWIPCKNALRAGTVDISHSDYWSDANIGINSVAMGLNAKATGPGSLAFGYLAEATGINAVTIGAATYSKGYGVVVGNNAACLFEGCVLMGQSLHGQAANALAFGSDLIVNGVHGMALGRNVIVQQGVGAIGIGDGGDTDVSMVTQFDNELRVRARGGVRFRTSERASNAPGVDGNTGCDLPSGSGSWTCASSRYVKENFTDVDGEDVLAKISAMPVTTWNYITENTAVRHMGPMAQDFYSAFALGTDSSSIGMIDINGVNLAAVKALEQRTADLKAAQDQLADKAMRIDALEARIARLEKALGKTLK